MEMVHAKKSAVFPGDCQWLTATVERDFRERPARL